MSRRPVPRPRCSLLLALVATLLCTGAPAHAQAAAATTAQTLWLCHPAIPDDACDGSLKTTIQEPDGSTKVEDPPVPKNPPVDCFYVYPTVSNQLGPNATKANEPEEQSIALYQASRFQQQCRVFAPIYRQLTLASIFDGGFTDATRKIAYDDVLAAWKDYLAHENHGRGIVLIGHSQGTGVLRRLIHDQIDPDPALRKQLVSALLLGGNVTVKAGSDRGGDFENVPLCTKDGQTSCVVAFSTYLDDPPPDSVFGRTTPGPDRVSGLVTKPGTEVACTNPASLADNAETPFHTYVPTKMFAPGTLAAGIAVVYGGVPPSAPTPWVQPPDRYTGRCARIGGAHVLKVRPLPGARHLNAFPYPSWGLHLVDVNGALGELQAVVDRQTAAYLATATPAAAPQLALTGPKRCVRTAVTLRLSGTGRAQVRALELRIGGLRVARDRTSPFAVRIPAARLKRTGATSVRVIATLNDGRVRTLTRTLRRCR
ncbi:MAG: hypothetical protein JWM31_342 [Solirubrobacterales bacterium]|nr:hypothetical protein [Solirubrobacterales bacterium]